MKVTEIKIPLDLIEEKMDNLSLLDFLLWLENYIYEIKYSEIEQSAEHFNQLRNHGTLQ
jgi:hypothetical protein